MRKPSIPRALTRTATAVTLAGAVTVPALGGTPAFATSFAGATATRPTASTPVAPHAWVPVGRFESESICEVYAVIHYPGSRHKCVRQERGDQRPWTLYIWRD